MYGVTKSCMCKRFKVKDKSMDFDATEKFIDRVFNLTLQLTFKKMTDDQSQLFEN